LSETTAAPFRFRVEGQRVQQNFAFDLEAEFFEKSSEGTRSRRIAGIVSTNDLDRQSEVLLQEGLDFGPFLKSGWFNDNHSADTDAVLGYPTKAELRTLPGERKGWYVEGYILKGTPRADRIWDLAQALQKSDRRLGFSVEGSVTERDPSNPRVVRKAVVREVAITRCPVNEATALQVLAKSLSAGSAVTDPGTSPGEGFPLRVQSLEGGPDPLRKKRKRRMNKAEAVALLKSLQPRLSDSAAEKIVDYAMRHHRPEE
jgi:hypothetical protein